MENKEDKKDIEEKLEFSPDGIRKMEPREARDLRYLALGTLLLVSALYCADLARQYGSLSKAYSHFMEESEKCPPRMWNTF